MIKISPSILSADFAYLARDIQAISTADYVHVDVMDGLFVPNISIGIPVVKCIRPVTDLPLDVHLMIQEPVRYVDQFCDAGADIVTCHVEADIQENILAAIDKIHDCTISDLPEPVMPATKPCGPCFFSCISNRKGTPPARTPIGTAMLFSGCPSLQLRCSGSSDGSEI